MKNINEIKKAYLLVFLRLSFATIWIVGLFEIISWIIKESGGIGC